MALYAPPTGIGQVIHFVAAALSHTIRFVRKTAVFAFITSFLLLFIVAPSYGQVPVACSGGAVAITIDDGPGPDTPAILDALKAANLKATFFVIGSYVQTYPDIAKRIVAEGHAVGNHSWDHPVMTTLTRAAIDGQIQQTTDIIKSVMGVTPIYFRPPYGQSNQDVYDSAVAHGLIHMWWTIDAQDYYIVTKNETPAQMSLEVAAQMSLTQPGGNVLLHNWTGVLPGAIASIASYWNTTLAATPVCAGQLAPSTNVFPVHDWPGPISYVKAIPW